MFQHPNKIPCKDESPKMLVSTEGDASTQQIDFLLLLDEQSDSQPHAESSTSIDIDNFLEEFKSSLKNIVLRIF